VEESCRHRLGLAPSCGMRVGCPRSSSCRRRKRVVTREMPARPQPLLSFDFWTEHSAFTCEMTVSATICFGGMSNTKIHLRTTTWHSAGKSRSPRTASRSREGPAYLWYAGGDGIVPGEGSCRLKLVELHCRTAAGRLQVRVLVWSDWSVAWDD
jgi:hypothetical protein